jgi:hypothetical protein
LAKVWKTRPANRQSDLKIKGLLPIDRRILLDIGRNLEPMGVADGAVGYCFQVAAMTAVDARIMKARTRCKATTPVGKTVALQIADAQSD